MQKYLRLTKKHIVKTNNQYVMQEFDKTSLSIKQLIGTCINVKNVSSGEALYKIKFNNFTKTYNQTTFKKSVIGYIPNPIDNTRCFYADVAIDGKELHGLIVGSKFHYANKVITLRKGMHKILCEYEEGEPIFFATPELQKIYDKNVNKNKQN